MNCQSCKAPILLTDAHLAVKEPDDSIIYYCDAHAGDRSGLYLYRMVDVKMIDFDLKDLELPDYPPVTGIDLHSDYEL